MFPRFRSVGPDAGPCARSGASSRAAGGLRLALTADGARKQRTIWITNLGVKSMNTKLMHHEIKKGWIVAALLAFGLGAAVPQRSMAEDAGEIEEVVVTGSYIKKSAADSPSPLSVVTRADIEEIGAIDIKDIVKNLTYSSGNLGGSSTAFFAGDSSTGNASLNLRNLGNGATLVLINGKRTVNTDFDLVGSAYVNVQNIIPNIAIERVEILKDGSSALYGSDAVAGVVNFITRQDFEGLELSVDYATDYTTGVQDDLSLAMLVGVSGDRGNISASASYLDRKELNIGDRYDRFGRTGLSTFGQPGRYAALSAIKPDTTSYFVPGGSTKFGEGADPDCDLAAAADGPMGVQGNVGGKCIYDFSSFFALVQPDETWKFNVDANLAISDSVEFFGSASYSDSFSDRNNSLYPDVSFATIGPDHFGNQLDAARRGIQPAKLLAMQRMMGGTVDSDKTERPLETRSTYERSYFATTAGITADLDSGWTLIASLGHSEAQYMGVNPSDTVTSNVDAAYVGLGGPDCDPLTGTAGSGNLGTGNCYYYNSFATSTYDPVTGSKWNVSDTSAWAADPTLSVQEAARKYQNPVALLQWMQGEIGVQTTRKQTVADIVLSGDVFDMKHGAFGIALGAQYRDEATKTDIDAVSNNNNFKFIYGAQDWTNEAETYGLFAEAFIPIAASAELQFAGRYESFRDLGEDTFDPKLTLLIRPNEDLSLRASVGTSFRVGSLLQTGGKNTALLNSTDPVSGTGGLAFRPTLTSGNPDLVPETSTMFNVGVSWIPTEGVLEGLSMDVDYYNYRYEDLISREAHQDLINQDNALRCPNGLNDDPDAGELCGVSDQDGNGVNEFYSVGAGLPDKVIRRADGGLLRTEAVYFNAPSLETSGIDFALAYAWDTQMAGSFKAQMNGSYTLAYDITTDKGAKIDGVGSRNNGNSIGRPLPQYKLNANLRWMYHTQAMVATVRYIDDYKDDTPQSALRGSYGFLAPTIGSHTELDLQYSLQEIGVFGGSSTFVFGIKNLTNKEPPIVNVDGGFDYFTHDPRGRIFYTRLTWSI